MTKARPIPANLRPPVEAQTKPGRAPGMGSTEPCPGIGQPLTGRLYDLVVRGRGTCPECQQTVSRFGRGAAQHERPSVVQIINQAGVVNIARQSTRSR